MSDFMVNEDRPGFCAKCHTPIAEFNGSNEYGNPIIVKLLPILRTIFFRLDNGSQLIVTLCVDCEETIDPSDSAQIMESVINGWQYEVDSQLHHWEEDKKIEHMKTFGKRFITDRTDKRWNDEQIKRITKPDKKKLRLKKEALN